MNKNNREHWLYKKESDSYSNYNYSRDCDPSMTLKNVKYQIRGNVLPITIIPSKLRIEKKNMAKGAGQVKGYDIS